VSRYLWRDQAYLLDMLTAARDARDFAAGLTRDGYEASRLAQYAPQIIGEAAARVSDDTRNSVGDVPWTQLIGLRNRLVHDYGRIDRDVLWDTLQVDMASLIDQLERLVSSDQSEHELPVND
jgi:uncharacterized protein with HEPN domain